LANKGVITGDAINARLTRISNDADRVKRFFSLFLLPFTEFEHTSSSTHELRLFLLLLFICVTLTCPARFRSSTQCCPPSISSITFDH